MRIEAGGCERVYRRRDRARGEQNSLSALICSRRWCGFLPVGVFRIEAKQPQVSHQILAVIGDSTASVGAVLATLGLSGNLHIKVPVKQLDATGVWKARRKLSSWHLTVIPRRITYSFATGSNPVNWAQPREYGRRHDRETGLRAAAGWFDQRLTGIVNG